MQLPNPHRSAWADEINAFILFTLTKETRFFKENVLFNQKQKSLLTVHVFALTVDHVMARIIVTLTFKSCARILEGRGYF